MTLVSSTPEIFSPPAPAHAPAPTFALPSTPARVSPSAPSSGSGAGSAPTSTSGSGTAPAPPDEDIRDIRGPKDLFPLWLAAVFIAGGVLLAAGGYALWRWKQRRRAPRALLPFEIALQRLEDIRKLLESASAREFSIAVSDIVRQYIEVQFSVTATHRTTEEFLRDLLESTNASLAAHRNLLAEFLNQCDLAKFAGVSLSKPILESLHRSARSFVIESSKPPPTPQAGAAQPSRIEEARDSLPTT